MLSSKLTAIVLKRSNFSESDKIITLFSREKGKIIVVAKGVRKIKSRRAPHLEPLNEVGLVLHKGKNYEIVSEAKSLNTPHFKLESLTYVLYALEIVDKLLPELEPHASVYELLRSLLLNDKIDENKIKEFTLKLIWTLGFLPHGEFPKEGLNNFVESLAEKQIRSKKLIDEL